MIDVDNRANALAASPVDVSIHQAPTSESKLPEDKLPEDIFTSGRTLQISPWIPLNDTDLEHRLLMSKPISQVSFIGDSRVKDKRTRTEKEWLFLLSLFQNRYISEHILRVTVADDEIPFHIVATLLWQFRAMEEFELESSGRKWRKCSWECFSSAIQQHSHLKQFRMSVACLAHVDRVVASLATVPNLQEYSLVFESNEKRQQLIKDYVGTIDQLLTALAKLMNRPSLRRLTCVRVGLGIVPCGSPGWNQFLSHLCTSRLKVLCLVEAGLEQDHCHQLIDTIQNHDTLCELNLSGNSLTYGVDALCFLVASDTKLKSLILSGCNLDDEAMARIAIVLFENSTLTHLDLANNMLCNLETMETFVTVMQANTRIVTLILETQSCQLYTHQDEQRLRQAKHEIDFYITRNRQMGRN